MVKEFVINVEKKIIMPDITMCKSEDCPLKKKCYRHEAKPSKFWQSYSDFTDGLNEEKTECEYFMKIWEK